LVKYSFGERLRAVRERRGITLRDVAARAGVSESLVSQIERSRVSPSIDTLLSLADVLEVDLEHLFADYRRKKGVNLVRAGERRTVSTDSVTYEQLARIRERADEYAIEALQLTIAPDGSRGNEEYGHRGSELGVILTGTAELVYGGATYHLEPGDSASFASDIPHVLKNAGDCPLVALWVTSPPRTALFE
jgi:transcriptional regulator with XRE-family HTH domain